MPESPRSPPSTCPWCGTHLASLREACPNCRQFPNWREWVDETHAIAEQTAPPGWQGFVADEPLDNLANVTSYLRRELAVLRVYGGTERGEFWLERANELYANIFRALSALKIYERPEQLPKAADCDEAERRLDELWRSLAAKERRSDSIERMLSAPVDEMQRLDDVAKQKTDAAIAPVAIDSFAAQSQCVTSLSQPIQSVASVRESGNFIFRRTGNGYEITGLGESGMFVSLRGLDYINRLISTPCQPVAMAELIGVVHDERIMADKQSRQPVLDNQAKSELNRQYCELQADLETANRNNDHGEVDRIHADLEALKEQLKSAVGLGGQSRDLNSPINKQRSAISGALSRAYEKFRKADPPMPKLAEHFEAAISSQRGTFIYRPAGADIVWNTGLPVK